MNSYIVEMLISSFYGKVVSGRQQMLNNAKSHECDPGSFFYVCWWQQLRILNIYNYVHAAYGSTEMSHRFCMAMYFLLITLKELWKYLQWKSI